MPGSSNDEPKGTRTRMSNGAVRPMYNDDAFNSDIDSPVEELNPNANGTNEAMTRVGKSFQVDPPECAPDKYSSKHEALLVWQPCTQKVSTEQVNQFCKLAKEKFKYSEEQALGMLLWHKHDADKATSQLANFIPFPDDWSSEDKVLFDQAYAFHGKSFYRIGEMLRGLLELERATTRQVHGRHSQVLLQVERGRGKASLMDRQAKQAPLSDLLTDISEDSDSDSSSKSEVGGAGPKCENCCSTSSTVTEHLQFGRLCQTCMAYIRRTGISRPFELFKRNLSKTKDSSLMPQRFNPTKNRKRPPKGSSHWSI
ncbi:RCOR3 [Bugula neritina]|uniref:RCOR3 n=1 Tax=Bugula neritina TaxID=10212 RepID=A0A7J7KJE6_BUGNE|nr:RCOR3 [Bugula neritina]